MLVFALLFVIIILIIDKTINNKKETTTETEQNSSELKPNGLNDRFTKKEYIMTPNELKFFKLVKTITDKNNLLLFTQVALYEIVKNKNYQDFNYIKSKTIDYIITEQNGKIKMCIELDDSTHNQPKRIERDTFINELMKELNIKLIRIPVQNYYNLEELEGKIKE